MRWITCTICLAELATALTAADLEVTRVALYKHGVGFYERSGEIPAGEAARLEFKASEMDDVLKSLTLVQQGGDGVAAVRYDSADPLEKRLEAFSFRVGSKASLADVLDQFKGARVSIQTGGRTLQGVVISARSYPDTDGAERQELLMTTDDGELRSVDPRSLESLRFVEEEVQQSFRNYLSVIAGSRNSERRSLILESSGGVSHVQAAYLAPAAVWKSSYRLILREDDEPLLEGWAIVDNTSSDDWNGVQLSLVSGLPVSFVNDLYEPRYVARNRVQLKQDRAWQPIIHGAAIEVLGPAQARANVDAGLGNGSIQGTVLDRSGAVIPMAIITVTGPGGSQYSATSALDGGFRVYGLPPGEYRVRIESAGFLTYQTRLPVGEGASMLSAVLEVGAVTETVSLLQTASATFRSGVTGSTVEEELFEGRNMGDLFAYDISRPVTVPAGQSAMLPFYSGQVEARRLLVFNESYGSQHPLNAVEINNQTGGTLDGGAMTVYDGGGYAGEAMVDTLKADDKRLVSYAVDLGVRITTKFRSESHPVREIHALDGMLLTRTLYRSQRTFLIHNVDPKAKTLWIEHVPDEGFEPVNVEPTERTADALRFEVPLEANSTREFVLTEERTGSDSITLSYLDYDEMRMYALNKDFDEQGRARLAEVAERMKQVADLEDQSKRLGEQLAAVNAEQTRLRGNIETLNSVAGQQQRVQEMAEQLAQNEARIKGLEVQVQTLSDDAERLQKQIEADLLALAF